MAKKWSTEKVKEYLESFDCELLSEYETERKNIKIKCKCGKIFEDKLSNIKYNQYCMCDECYLIYKSEKSFNDFMKELEEIGYTYISNRKEYKNSKSLVYVKCNKGHIIKTSKNKIHSGYRCAKCNKENPKPRKIRKNYNIIKEEIELYDYKLLTKKENYKGVKSEIQIECNKGHIYQTCYNVFQQGHRCPYCDGKVITYEEVRGYIKQFDYELLSKEYINAQTKLLVKCPKNHQYEVAWNSFQRGNRCPICNSSKGEEKIKNFLENHKINFIKEKRFDDCRGKIKPLPFDFYLPQYNCCIEYDGTPHYRYGTFNTDLLDLMNRKYLDNIKTKYCEGNNIKLIRIPYWDFDKNENILELELKIKCLNFNDYIS